MERMLQGFSPDDPMNFAAVDLGEVTAGRNRIWPHVAEKIKESPVVGFGREAMIRTGLTEFTARQLLDEVGHPHNGYLEWLLDNGWVGLVPVMAFYIAVLIPAFSLFRDSRSEVSVAIGGVTAALTLALVIAAAGSQTFYPREGNIGMWCAIGLMFRVRQDGDRLLSANPPRSPVVTQSPLRRSLPRPSPVRSRWGRAPVSEEIAEQQTHGRPVARWERAPRRS
jgi:hypothetical protein